MRLDITTIKDFYDSITKIIDENHKFKNGFIQSFLDINGEKCKICGGNKIVAYPYPSLNKLFRYKYVYGCCSCGISYINYIDDINLSKYYEDEYAKTNRKDRELPPKEYFSMANSKLNKYFNRSRRHLKYINSVYNKDIINILDFGSGPGYFSYLVNAKNKFSIELDLNCKKYLDYIGVNQLKFNDIQTYKFDIIYSSHALEHLFIDNLITTTTTMYNSLSDDGIIFFEVPCGELLRFPLYSRHDPHTIFFSAQSLDLILLKSGFKSIFIFLPSHKSTTIRNDAK